MTKLKTAAITCMAVSGISGWAFAQGGASSAFPTPSSSASSSSVSAPRTGLYSGVTKGNAAADNTVDDYSRRPTLIGNKQYFAGWGGANLNQGAFSFDGKGFNWFGSVVNNNTADLLRLGIGKGTSWGGGLLLTVNRNNVTNAAGETKTTVTGDGLGAFGDFNLGSSDVYGQLGWFTDAPGSVTNTPDAGSETSQYNWHLNVMAGWKKDATTEGTHSLNFELNYTIAKASSDGITPEIDASMNQIRLDFFHGYILKAASDYAVFLGDNSDVIWEASSNDSPPPSSDGSHVGVAVSPNLAFQKQLGHGFEGFSGASVTLAFDTYSDDLVPGPPPPAGTTDYTTLLTGSADVAVGLRWVKDNFALEGSLKETVLANGPYIIGGNAGQGLFVDVGMSLGI